MLKSLIFTAIIPLKLSSEKLTEWQIQSQNLLCACCPMTSANSVKKKFLGPAFFFFVLQGRKYSYKQKCLFVVYCLINKVSYWLLEKMLLDFIPFFCVSKEENCLLSSPVDVL